VGGAEAGRVVGEPRDGEAGCAHAGGAERAAREHDPREVAGELARGGAPCAADGGEAGAVGRPGTAGAR